MALEGLILHCGGKEVDWDTIEMCPTPESTKTWTPIPHSELITGVKDTLIRGGLHIENEQYGLSYGGNRCFGLMHLTNGNNSDDYGTVLGIRNSHDKKFPAGLSVGAGVFVCDNLSFSGEITIARKHTKQIRKDLPRLIETAVGKIGDARISQDKRFDAYKQHELTDKDVHDLTIQALDVQAISTRTLPQVIQEWRQPTHPEFTEDGKTLWRYFNACTEALKHYAPENLPKRTMALHGLLDSCVGLAI